jgi:hypothetical protein
MPSEMVERVALAMQEAAEGPVMFSANFWPDSNRPDAAYTKLARAAIAAMREPTEAMIEASNREWDGRMSHRSSGAWQAMIDEALK